MPARLRHVLGLIVAASALDPRDFDADPQLPGLHYVPFPGRWVNDPNGVMFDPVHGVYHLFYQQQPLLRGDWSRWGNVSWGHAVSHDLVSWTQLPDALPAGSAPGGLDPLSGSGSILADGEKTPLLTVSTSGNDLVFAAVPVNRTDPHLTEWRVSHRLYRGDARDPTEIVRTSDGRFRVFDGEDGKVGVWEAESMEAIFAEDGFGRLGTVQDGADTYWECPELFKLPGGGGHYVLKQSRFTYVEGLGNTYNDKFWVGEYDEQGVAFSPLGDSQHLDECPRWYASKRMRDVEGRQVLWAWLVHHTSVYDFRPDYAWEGALSIPRLVEADVDGRHVRSFPIPELEKLRGQRWTADPSSVVSPDMEPLPVRGAKGTMLDIEASILFRPSSPQAEGNALIQCGVRVLGNVEVVRSYEDIVSRLPAGRDRGDGVLEVKLRVIVDRSIIEAFWDTTEGQVGVRTDYTNSTAGTDVALIAKGAGGHCEFQQANVWAMRPFDFEVLPNVPGPEVLVV